MRISFLLLTLTCFSLKGIAQKTFQTYIEKDPVAVSLNAESIVESINGDIFVVSTTDPDGFTNKIRLTKLNGLGTIQWDTVYTFTPNHEFSPEIIPTKDGGVIIASDSFSYPLDDEDSLEDILVWKMDQEGKIEWQQVLSARHFRDMIVSEDGNILILGEIHESSNNQGLDLIIYKIDFQGNIIWNKRLGQKNVDLPWNMEWATSINEINKTIYVSGFHTMTSGPGKDAILYSLDSNANLNWDIFIAHSSTETDIRMFFVVKFDNQLFFRISGGLYQFDALTGNYQQVIDSTRMAFTNKGYNFSNDCGINKLSVLRYQSGIYSLNLFDNLTTPYYTKSNLSISGTMVEMIHLKDGGYVILSGISSGIPGLMQVTKLDCLGNDFWSDECNSKIPKDNQLIVYPNPSDDEIRIDATFDFNEVIIFSPNGQYISYENPCHCLRQTLDVSQLAAGVYIVRISSDENFAISRFVKI